MSLIKWTKPSNGLTKRQDLMMPSMENLLSNFFNDDLGFGDYAGYVPTVNITESEKAYGIEVSAPGFEKNDFNLRVEDGVLTVSGEHKMEKNEEKKNFVRKEFNYGSFSRSFNLIDLVDEEKIDAKYESGILKLELPKNEKAKAQNVREIKIS
ncbi:MAG: Hsp20/alpha crystallin family protein [Bacteroidia bacterium]